MGKTYKTSLYTHKRAIMADRVLSKEDVADKHFEEFLNCFCDLMSRSNNLKVAMCTDELPKDMSGADSLLQKHHANKNKMEMMDEDFRQAAKLGQKLLHHCSCSSDEVKEKMVTLANERTSLRVVCEKRQLLYEQCKDLQRFYQEIEEANKWIDQQQASLAVDEDEMNIDSLIQRQDELEQAVARQDIKIKALDELASKLIDDLHSYVTT